MLYGKKAAIELFDGRIVGVRFKRNTVLSAVNVLSCESGCTERGDSRSVCSLFFSVVDRSSGLQIFKNLMQSDHN